MALAPAPPEAAAEAPAALGHQPSGDAPCAAHRPGPGKGLSSWSPAGGLQSPAPRRTWSPGRRQEGRCTPQAGASPGGHSAGAPSLSPLSGGLQPGTLGSPQGTDSHSHRGHDWPLRLPCLWPVNPMAVTGRAAHRCCPCAVRCRHTVGAHVPPSEGRLDGSRSGPRSRGGRALSAAQASGFGCQLRSDPLVSQVSAFRANLGSHPSVRPDQVPRPPQSVGKRPAAGNRLPASPCSAHLLSARRSWGCGVRSRSGGSVGPPRSAAHGPGFFRRRNPGVRGRLRTRDAGRRADGFPRTPLGNAPGREGGPWWGPRRGSGPARGSWEGSPHRAGWCCPREEGR